LTGPPWITLEARAGKNFYKRLPAARVDEASDEVSEHFVGDELWVERGIASGGQPFVKVHRAPAENLITLAQRLSRTSSGARLRVRIGTSGGRERYRLLKDAGLDVTAQ